ncbi:MAG TPA: pentapeptide repeat-containing protein [Gammaproteobacteria bacterium]|jgi:uncharacterized protein YjbI with pentapeptide repeats|nr:pentapeptide repeat-containing protein [Gammaproteobacteria bacterium]
MKNSFLLPEELTLHIFSFFRPIDFYQVKQVCKDWERIASTLDPKTVFLKLHTIDPEKVMTFLSDYRNSSNYKDLCRKNDNNLLTSHHETACYALTTNNIYSIHPKRLEEAINYLQEEEEIKNNPTTYDYLNNLKIALLAIDPTIDPKEKWEKIKERLNERAKQKLVFLNLSGIKLTQLVRNSSYETVVDYCNDLNFSLTNLSEADFSKLQFVRCYFHHSNFYNFKFDNSDTYFIHPYLFTNPYLRFYECDFSHADFTGANLIKMRFTKCLFKDTNLAGAGKGLADLLYFEASFDEHTTSTTDVNAIPAIPTYHTIEDFVNFLNSCKKHFSLFFLYIENNHNYLMNKWCSDVADAIQLCVNEWKELKNKLAESIVSSIEKEPKEMAVEKLTAAINNDIFSTNNEQSIEMNNNILIIAEKSKRFAAEELEKLKIKLNSSEPRDLLISKKELIQNNYNQNINMIPTIRQ